MHALIGVLGVFSNVDIERSKGGAHGPIVLQLAVNSLLRHSGYLMERRDFSVRIKWICVDSPQLDSKETINSLPGIPCRDTLETLGRLAGLLLILESIPLTGRCSSRQLPFLLVPRSVYKSSWVGRQVGSKVEGQVSSRHTFGANTARPLDPAISPNQIFPVHSQR